MTDQVNTFPGRRAEFEAWARTNDQLKDKLGRAPWPHEEEYTWSSASFAWSMWQTLADRAANEGMRYPSIPEFEAALAHEREACARSLEMTNAELLLMAGEMTAQELRTVQAVLKAKAAAIRRNDLR